MIGPPPGTRVYLAAGITDMRKGFDGLAALVQQHLKRDPFGGAVYAFRGRRGDLVKLLWWDGQGLVLHAKRLERGRFIWPATAEGCGADPGAAVDATRRGRLAAPDPVLAAVAGVVIIGGFASFFGVSPE